jgi:hypothetical protein
MGQAANSGRNASLDQKKERSEGRKQNDPARKQIANREAPPQARGAFGRGNRTPGKSTKSASRRS